MQVLKNCASVSNPVPALVTVDQVRSGSRVNVNSSSSGNTKSTKTCGNCGRQHPPRACPAFGKICRACNKAVSADLPVIQCVHDVTNSHWLTSSTVGCPADNVNVYCSMQQWPIERCFNAITSYLKFTGDTVVARLANVSKQDGAVIAGCTQLRTQKCC